MQTFILALSLKHLPHNYVCVFQVTNLEESVAVKLFVPFSHRTYSMQEEHQNSFLVWGVSPEDEEAILLNSALGKRKKKKP